MSDLARADVGVTGAQPVPANQPPPNKWVSGGALVVVTGAVPAGFAGGVVVCQNHDAVGKILSGGYPTDADLYLQMADASASLDPETGAVVPAPAPFTFGQDPTRTVLRLGVDVAQGGFGGLSVMANVVHVVPASLAYAGINLAYQRGANTITTLGLSDAQKAALQPYVDAVLQRSGVEVPQGSKTPFVRADLNITLG